MLDDPIKLIRRRLEEFRALLELAAKIGPFGDSTVKR
jgi:hypothetical protein